MAEITMKRSGLVFILMDKYGAKEEKLRKLSRKQLEARIRANGRRNSKEVRHYVAFLKSFDK